MTVTDLLLGAKVVQIPNLGGNITVIFDNGYKLNIIGGELCAPDGTVLLVLTRPVDAVSAPPTMCQQDPSVLQRFANPFDLPPGGK